MAVLTLAGAPIDWSNPPSLTTRVKWSYADDQGDPVEGCLFVIAALDHANDLAVQRFGTRIHVLQPPFNEGVAASAGTHDFDFCMDLWIPGVDGFTQQRFFRDLGWCMWFRQPWQGFGFHQHGFPMPPGGKKFPTKVGVYVDGGASQGKSGFSSQLDDYWHRTYGLKGLHSQGQDKSYFPSSSEMMEKIFDLAAYTKEQEELMASDYDDWSPEAKVSFWDDFEKRFLDKATVTLKKGPGSKDDKEIPIRAVLERLLNGS